MKLQSVLHFNEWDLLEIHRNDQSLVLKEVNILNSDPACILYIPYHYVKIIQYSYFKTYFEKKIYHH